MRITLVALMLVLAFAAVAGADDLPGGSYQQSCFGCSASGGVLTCQGCYNQSGQSIQATLDYSNCPLPIANCETQLKCGNCDNSDVVCGQRNTYPACFNWGDGCYKCQDCFEHSRWCRGGGR